MSDHTLGLGASIAAVSHGATIIEKHFTLNRSDGGVDSVFSLEPAEMRELVAEAERARLSIGNILFGPTESEKENLKFRRSIYISSNIKKGDKLTNDNIKIVRPSFGLHPKHYKTIIGLTVNQDLIEGTALKWSFIDEKD